MANYYKFSNLRGTTKLNEMEVKFSSRRNPRSESAGGGGKLKNIYSMRLQFKSKSWGLCLYVANDDAYPFAIKITPRKLTFWCSYWICVTDYRQGYEIKGKFCVCWNLTTRKWKLFWRNLFNWKMCVFNKY